MTRPGEIFYIILSTQVFLVLGIINHVIAFLICINHTPAKPTIPFAGPFGLKPCGWPAANRPGIFNVGQCRVFSRLIEIPKYRIKTPLYRSCWISIHFFPVAGLQIIKCVVVLSINIRKLRQRDCIQRGCIAIIFNEDLGAHQQSDPICHF